MISLPDFGLQRGSASSPTLTHACFSLTNMNPRVTTSVSVSAHSSVRPAADDCLNPPCSPVLTCIRPRPVLTHIRPRLVLTSTRSLLERVRAETPSPRPAPTHSHRSIASSSTPLRAFHGRIYIASSCSLLAVDSASPSLCSRPCSFAVS